MPTKHTVTNKKVWLVRCKLLNYEILNVSKHLIAHEDFEHKGTWYEREGHGYFISEAGNE